MVTQYGREPRSAESIKNSLQLSVARNRKCRRFLKCAQIYINYASKHSPARITKELRVSSKLFSPIASDDYFFIEYRKRIVGLSLALVLWVPVGSAATIDQPFNYQWNIREIVSTDGDTIELHTRQKRLIATVDKRQIRILLAVKSSIETVAEIHTELIIVDGDQPNAFAGKGKNGENVIGINIAMLDILSLDAHVAAALIGHEIAHLKLHHGDNRKSNKNETAVIRVLGGVALNALGLPSGGLISDLAFTAIETQYSRDNESEADYLGTIWAVEAGYEPDGGVRLHKKIYDRSRYDPIPFLSSHPTGPKRISTLKGLSQRLSR